MMLRRVKHRVGESVAFLADGVLLAGSLAGVSFSVVFGKLLAGALFLGIAAGIGARLARRRRPDPPAASRATPGVSIVSAVVAAGAVAALVEMINLPVRYDQAGFEKSNLLVVVAGFLAAFYGARWLIVSLRRPGRNDSPDEAAR